ncbi:hypothetical protein NUW58_g2119 [Xylaria curta]|uniref:Uncharacterized protein n=2 Tax=Xylaria curta TaxID=42375 RepID=A0ACC1P2T0_9PEZI|nr:hypothetical protein NUW58_g5749 [Xylaria curta]KAJ2992565.1 hypothetical protein NUW58_g2119 [Xylaria curta]
MRVTLSTIALCTIGALAAVPPTDKGVQARQENAGTWYFLGFRTDGNVLGAPRTSFAIFGAPNAVPGAPAFGLRCHTLGGCENGFPGANVRGQGPLGTNRVTVTQNFEREGKAYIATAAVDWDGSSLVSFELPVTVTAA